MEKKNINFRKTTLRIQFSFTSELPKCTNVAVSKSFEFQRKIFNDKCAICITIINFKAVLKAQQSVREGNDCTRYILNVLREEYHAGSFVALSRIIMTIKCLFQQYDQGDVLFD